MRLPSVCELCDGHPERGRHTLRTGEVLYLGGAPAISVFCLLDGFLKESFTMEDGRILGIRIVHVGELVGTETLLGGAYQCTVEALVPSRVCAVSAEDVRTTLAEQPEQGVAFSQALGRELMNLRTSMVRLATLNATEKVQAIIEELLGDSEKGVWVRLPLSRQELAELLGLALATVSRTLRGLARAGVYEVSGRQVRRL